MVCTNLGNVLGDDDQADQHADVGQHREDGQDPEVPKEDQQHQDGQEGEHVESRVYRGCENHRLIVMAIAGGAINSFHHLRKEWERQVGRVNTSSGHVITQFWSTVKLPPTGLECLT